MQSIEEKVTDARIKAMQDGEEKVIAERKRALEKEIEQIETEKNAAIKAERDRQKPSLMQRRLLLRNKVASLSNGMIRC